MPLIDNSKPRESRSYNSPELRAETIFKYIGDNRALPQKSYSYNHLPQAVETLDDLEAELKRGDTAFSRDVELVLSYIGDDGDDIFETLRDADYNLTRGVQRAIEAKNWPQEVKDAYARIRTRYDAADTGSFNQWMKAAKDIGIDLISDPITLISLLASPFTGGASLGARAAVGEAAKAGVKRYGQKALISTTTLGATEGAVWTGVQDWATQSVEEAVGLRDDYSMVQTLAMASAGGFAGGIVGRLVDNRAVTKVERLLDETGLQVESEIAFRNKPLAKIISQTIGKPATYLDPYVDASPTAKKLQRLLRYDMNREWTNPLNPMERAPIEEDFFMKMSRIGGRNLRTFKDLVEPISFNRSGKLTSEVNDKLIKAIRTGESDDETILQVARGVRNLLDSMKEDMVKYKLIDKKSDITNYFPRSWNRKAIEKNRSRMEELLVEAGEAEDLSEAAKIVDELLDKKNQTGSVVGHISGAKRTFTKITDDDMFAEFLDNDVVEVMHNYISQASKRMAVVDTFGVNSLDQFKKKWVDPIVDELKGSGVTLKKNEREYLEALYKNATGDGLDYPDGAWGAFKEGAAIAYQVSLLPLATISSLTEIMLPLTRTTAPAYFKALAQGIGAGVKKMTVDTLDMLKIKHNMSRPQVFKEMNKFMIALDQGAASTIERLAGEGARSKTGKRIQDTFFKAIGLTQWTHTVEATSFIVGKDLIRSNLTSLKKAKNLNSRGMIRKINELSDLGIDWREGVEWIKRGGKDTDSYYEKVLQGASVFTREIILPTSREAGTRPHIQTHPQFDILTQFLGYPTAFSNVVLKGFARTAADAPVFGSLKLLSAGASMTAIARATNYWRTDGRSEEEGDFEANKRAILRWGGGGLLLDMVDRSRDLVEATQNPLAAPVGFLGPLPGEVITSFRYGRGPAQVIGTKIPGYTAGYAILGKEPMDDYNSLLRAMDKKLLDAMTGKKTPERVGRATGGLVSVPNAPARPEQRKDKMTGLSYDIQSGLFSDRQNYAVGGLVKALVSKIVKGSAEEVVPPPAAVTPTPKPTPSAMAPRKPTESTLDMSREARMQRARELGFDPDRVYYHGTSHDFEEFSKDKLGSLTGADSAMEGFFFSSSPRTSSGYAKVSGDMKYYDWEYKKEFEELQKSIEELEGDIPLLRKNIESQSFSKEILDVIADKLSNKKEELKRLKERYNTLTTGPNIIPVHLKFSNPKIIDMKFTTYADKNRPRLGEEIRKAKEEGYDAVIFQNFSDTVDNFDEHIVDTTKRMIEENYPEVKMVIDSFNKSRKILDPTYFNPEETYHPDGLDHLVGLISDMIDEGGSVKDFPEFEFFQSLPEDINLEKLRKDFLDVIKAQENIERTDFADQIVVFEPNQIRSVNAKFDPKYKDSGRLMKFDGGVVSEGTDEAPKRYTSKTIAALRRGR